MTKPHDLCPRIFAPHHGTSQHRVGNLQQQTLGQSSVYPAKPTPSAAAMKLISFVVHHVVTAAKAICFLPIAIILQSVVAGKGGVDHKIGVLGDLRRPAFSV